MKIIQFGVPRSGSTVVWQILDSIFPGQVVKTHAFEDGDYIFITYRDFRDTFASLWRVFCGGFSDNENLIKCDIHSGDSIKCIKEIKQHVEILNKYKSKTNGKKIWLKYEDFHENLEQVIKEIENIFNLEVSDKIKIISKFSKNSNKEISKKFKDFNNYDKPTHIHGLHVFNGSVGTWKEIIPTEQHEEINNIFEECLREWGYY